MRRIARGIEKFVLKNPSPFIIQVNHGGENFRGQDIAEPLDTITAKHGTGVVMPMMIQYHDEQGSEVRGQTIDKPIMTVDASNRYGMVSAFISKFYGTSSPASAADAPLPTVTAIDHNALCAAYVTQFNNNCDGQCADEPLNTITARAGHFLEMFERSWSSITGMETMRHPVRSLRRRLHPKTGLDWLQCAGKNIRLWTSGCGC